jgi:formylmethanofuran dehydrogenase subunit E
MTKKSPKYPADLKRVIDFHGHLCPGLLIGYRASELALRLGGLARSEDEELVAVCENTSCSLDAVQVMTGCTLGKGNLFLRDTGKQVFTFAARPGGGGLRLSLRAEARLDASGRRLSREEFAQVLLERPAEELFEWRRVEVALPPEAEIRESFVCEACSESTMDTRTRQVGGRRLCLDCAAKTEGKEPPAPYRC